LAAATNSAWHRGALGSGSDSLLGILLLTVFGLALEVMPNVAIAPGAVESASGRKPSKSSDRRSAAGAGDTWSSPWYYRRLVTCLSRCCRWADGSF